MQTEAAIYYLMAERDYPDVVATHEDTTNRQQIIAETVYFYVHHRLPAWTTELEYVEEVKNNRGEVSYIFVQRDPSKAN